MNREKLVPLLEIAIAMRRRVTDQVAKILPSTFIDVDYGSKVRER